MRDTHHVMPFRAGWIGPDLMVVWAALIYSFRRATPGLGLLGSVAVLLSVHAASPLMVVGLLSFGLRDYATSVMFQHDSHA